MKPRAQQSATAKPAARQAVAGIAVQAPPRKAQASGYGSSPFWSTGSSGKYTWPGDAPSRYR